MAGLNTDNHSCSQPHTLQSALKCPTNLTSGSSWPGTFKLRTFDGQQLCFAPVSFNVPSECIFQQFSPCSTHATNQTHIFKDYLKLWLSKLSFHWLTKKAKGRTRTEPGKGRRETVTLSSLMQQVFHRNSEDFSQSMTSQHIWDPATPSDKNEQSR